MIESRSASEIPDKLVYNVDFSMLTQKTIKSVFKLHSKEVFVVRAKETVEQIAYDLGQNLCLLATQLSKVSPDRNLAIQQFDTDSDNAIKEYTKQIG